jgi:hypothetical protein
MLAQSYNFQVVECGAFTTRPAAINNAGVIVGEAQAINSTVARGFIYAQGTCSTISLGGRGTSFLGISNANEVFGIYTQTRDYLLARGGFAQLPSYPGVFSSYTSFKNAAGVIGGNYYTNSQSSYGIGFFYANGKFASLPGSDLKQATLYGL